MSLDVSSKIEIIPNVKDQFVGFKIEKDGFKISVSKSGDGFISIRDLKIDPEMDFRIEYRKLYFGSGIWILDGKPISIDHFSYKVVDAFGFASAIPGRRK